MSKSKTKRKLKPKVKTKPKPKPTLLTLPFEIREEIWKYVCDDSTVTLTWYKRRCDCKWNDQCPCQCKATYNRSWLLFVCRQIYAEAATVFMQSTQVNCYAALLPRKFLRISTQDWRINITDLRMGCYLTHADALYKLWKQLPRLKVLRLFHPRSHQCHGTERNPSYWRQLAAAEVLFIVDGFASVPILVRFCPNIDIICSRAISLRPHSKPQDNNPAVVYVSLVQCACCHKSLTKLKNVEFRSETMTITFNHLDRPGSISKSEFDEGDYAIEPKLVELSKDSDSDSD